MIETPALFPTMTAYQNMEIQRIQRGIPDKAPHIHFPVKNQPAICYTGITYEIPGQDLLKGEFVSKCLEYRVYQRGQHLECPY